MFTIFSAEFFILTPRKQNIYIYSFCVCTRRLIFISYRQMHDEVSETENLRKNLAVERMIVEGCDILLDVNQVFVRQGKFHVHTHLQYRHTYISI